MPLREDIGKAYAAYYTHAFVRESLAYRLRQHVKRGYAGLGVWLFEASFRCLIVSGSSSVPSYQH